LDTRTTRELSDPFVVFEVPGGRQYRFAGLVLHFVEPAARVLHREVVVGLSILDRVETTQGLQQGGLARLVLAGQTGQVGDRELARILDGLVVLDPDALEFHPDNPLRRRPFG
jgi:hypothetical protein